MSWVVVFAGLVVLLVAIYVGIGWWGQLVEREQRQQRRVLETWQEPPPDEPDTAGRDQTA